MQSPTIKDIRVILTAPAGVNLGVVKVETLHPWRGLGAARADTVIEFPAGAAADVEVGDRVRVGE